MTTETNTAPAATSPGRAACEAFWAAIGAGPIVQDPGAAWGWAVSQGVTGAWEAAAKAAAGIAGEVASRAIRAAELKLAATEDFERERDEARAELDKLRNACKHMGSVIVSMSRQMECARIEMLQNGPEKAMQWILNSIPDVDDNDPADQWNGTETAAEWLDRNVAADKAAEAEAAPEGTAGSTP